MTLSFSGMVATVGLPPPWGLISSGGVVIRAHGALTGQDTQTYAVNFASLVPASGSVTAYLVATPAQIQQNSFSIPGPPQGHPSFNPNFVPTIGYASTVDSVALAASGAAPGNSSSFELFRTTLTAGQSVISVVNTVGQVRAADRKAWPGAVLASGGALTAAQAQTVLSPASVGLTSTLPPASGAGGLVYNLVNPTSGNWTIATTGSDLVAGFGLSGASGASSIVLPPSGAVVLWGGAAYGTWSVLGASPNLFPNLLVATNTWTGTNAFSQGVVFSGSITQVNGQLMYGVDTSGVAHGMIGYLSDNYLHLYAGPAGLTIQNNLASVNLLLMDNSGNGTFAGNVTAKDTAVTSLTLKANDGSASSAQIYTDTAGLRPDDLVFRTGASGSYVYSWIDGYGNGTFAGTVTAAAGVSTTGFDANGASFRAIGGSYGFIIRNDGSSTYFLLTNSGGASGAWNSFLPFFINNANGAVTIDGTGAGVTIGKAGGTTSVRGALTVQNAVASNQPVALGQINAPIQATTYGSGTNTTVTVTASFTAPSAGILFAIGAINKNAVAASSNTTSLVINGVQVDSDNNPLPNTNMGSTTCSAGAVSASYTVASVNSFTVRVSLIFIPNV